jgi:hypothetical protein
MEVRGYYLMDFSNSSRIDVSFVNEILLAASPRIFISEAHFNAPPCSVQDSPDNFSLTLRRRLQWRPCCFNCDSEGRNTSAKGDSGGGSASGGAHMRNKVLCR